MLKPWLGHLSFWLTFIGFHVTFFPQHLLGLAGMPRRVYTYSEGLGWDGYNLVSTIGAFTIAAGVLVFVINAIWSLTRRPDAPDNPWHGDTLEWATSSPPESYDFERIPVVHSREPLWDEAHEDDLDTTQRPLGHGREVIATSVLDARPEAVLAMAEESYLPLVTAIGLALAFAGALKDSVWWVAPGVVITAVALAMWLWKRPADATDPVRILGQLIPPANARGARAPGNWGMAVFILTESMLFGSLFAAYFLIRGSSPQWPPAGIDAPALITPAILTLILAVTSGIVVWIGEERGSPARLRVGLIVTIVLGVVFLGLQLFEYSREEFSIHTNAYGSLFYAITGLHFTHLLVGVLMMSFVLARSWFVSAEDARRVDLPKAGAYWHFIGVVWLFILSVVYIAARWL
jgi:heme/copper-type cytochrome/quinol oxidase subunit 3